MVICGNGEIIEFLGLDVGGGGVWGCFVGFNERGGKGDVGGKVIVVGVK